MADISVLGGLDQLQMVVDGLRRLESVSRSLAEGGLRWVPIVVVFLVLIWYLSDGVFRRRNLWPAVGFFVFAGWWLDSALYTQSPITPGRAVSDVEADQRVAWLRGQISSLRGVVSSAEDPDRIAGAQRQLAELEPELAALEQFQHARGGDAIAHAPGLWLTAWRLSYALGRGLDSALQHYQPLRPDTRRWQEMVFHQLASSPALSAGERGVIEQLGECIKWRSVLSFAVSRAPRGRRAALETCLQLHPSRADACMEQAIKDTAAILDRKFSRADRACRGLDGKMAEAIDASITSEEIASAEHWINLGSVHLLRRGEDAKRKFLVESMGLDPDRVRGMSSRELARVYLRYRHIQSMADTWGQDLEEAASGNSGGANSLKADAGGWLAGWLLDFLAGARDWVLVGVNYAWWFAVLAWSAVVIWALIPGQHMRAPLSYLVLLAMISTWQVTINLIESHAAKMQQQEVHLAQQTTGPLAKTDALVGEAWQKIKARSADVISIVAGTHKSEMRRLVSTATEKTARLLTKIAGGSGIPMAAAALATIGLTTTADVWRGFSEDQKRAAQLIGSVGNLDPLLLAVANAGLAAQRRLALQRRERAAAIEGLLLLASPIITLFVWFLGFRSWTALGIGERAAAGASALGGTLAGSAIGRLRIGGGGGAKPPTTGGGKSKVDFRDV